ncbi:hypothetical protein B296_00054766 [Ensete ventricosum]|uniref:Uncharacterized protein n=1 Tax=Ensete ventricosum TaxID=4639 RepID=A0A426XF49_ENSVE|nr:hypothetical protein B296_00054766 [Ensete ventricosum]
MKRNAGVCFGPELGFIGSFEGNSTRPVVKTVSFVHFAIPFAAAVTVPARSLRRSASAMQKSNVPNPAKAEVLLLSHRLFYSLPFPSPTFLDLSVLRHSDSSPAGIVPSLLSFQPWIWSGRSFQGPPSSTATCCGSAPRRRAVIHFQDFNAEVLRSLTIPNSILRILCDFFPGILAACLLAEVADGSSNVREVWKLMYK